MPNVKCFLDWGVDSTSKTVKKSAKVIIERYYPKLTLDFETNKRICDEIAIIASKRLRNKVGFNFQAWDTSISLNCNFLDH